MVYLLQTAISVSQHATVTICFPSDSGAYFHLSLGDIEKKKTSRLGTYAMFSFLKIMPSINLSAIFLAAVVFHSLVNNVKIKFRTLQVVFHHQ